MLYIEREALGKSHDESSLMRYARASLLKDGTEPFDDVMNIGGSLQIGKEQSCWAKERTSFCN